MLVFGGVSFLTEVLAEDGFQDLFEGDEFEPPCSHNPSGCVKSNEVTI